MTEKGYSQRRACGLVGIAPKTFRYVSRRPDDAELRDRLKALADARRRFGYRRLHLLLRREGVDVNHKKLFRLYREERLAVRRRGGRKRALGTRAPMTIPQGPNQRWSTDFLHDVLTDGRRFRVWALVDDFSRECLALVVDTSISGRRIARELDRVVELRGLPCMIVSDNRLSAACRSDLRSRRGQQAAEGDRVHLERHPRLGLGHRRRLALHRAIEGQEAFDPAPGRDAASRPRRGKPMQNAFVESFNGRLRDECLL
jgi:putative transposase